MLGNFGPDAMIPAIPHIEGRPHARIDPAKLLARPGYLSAMRCDRR
jgi:hypothetical protein